MEVINHFLFAIQQKYFIENLPSTNNMIHTSVLQKKFLLMFLLRRSCCFYHFKKLFPFGAQYYPWQFSYSSLKPCFSSLKSPHLPTRDNFTRVQEFWKDPLLNSVSTSKDVFRVIAILLSISTILSIYYSH